MTTTARSGRSGYGVLPTSSPKNRNGRGGVDESIGGRDGSVIIRTEGVSTILRREANICRTAAENNEK